MVVRTVKINDIDNIKKFVTLAGKAVGCVDVCKGRQIVDGASLMGVLYIDMSTGVDVCYVPQDNPELDDFLDEFRM